MFHKREALFADEGRGATIAALIVSESRLTGHASAGCRGHPDRS